MLNLSMPILLSSGWEHALIQAWNASPEDIGVQSSIGSAGNHQRHATENCAVAILGESWHDDFRRKYTMSGESNDVRNPVAMDTVSHPGHHVAESNDALSNGAIQGTGGRPR